MSWYPLTEHWYFHIGAAFGFGAGIVIGYVLGQTHYIHGWVNKLVKASTIILIAFTVGIMSWLGGASAQIQTCKQELLQRNDFQERFCTKGEKK